MMRLSLSTALLVMAVAAPGANAATYELPADGSDIIGAVSTTTASYEDTLIDIAQRSGLGYEEIVRANPDVNVWVPGEGTEVVLPTRYILPSGPREGIVLNLAEYRLYYFPQPQAGEVATVMTFPISIGRMDWETPLGRTRVIAKAVDPAWYPPQSVREEHAAEGRPLPSIVPPGPDNPLGRHAMRLGLPGYLIHGTNRPAGVGMRVTHGCLRMFPEDIEYLFDFIAINTPVRIVNEPVKFGWQADELLIEVHPLLATAVAADAPADPLDETLPDEPLLRAVSVDTLDDTLENSLDDSLHGNSAPDGEAGEVDIPPAPVDPLTLVTERFVVATEERPGELDWLRVEDVVRRADGMPVAVGAGIKNAATSAASE